MPGPRWTQFESARAASPAYARIGFGLAYANESARTASRTRSLRRAITFARGTVGESCLVFHAGFTGLLFPCVGGPAVADTYMSSLWQTFVVMCRRVRDCSLVSTFARFRGHFISYTKSSRREPPRRHAHFGGLLFLCSHKSARGTCFGGLW